MTSLSFFLETYGFPAIEALFVAFFGIISIKYLMRLLNKALSSSKLDKTLSGFASGVIRIALYVLLLFLTLQCLNIPISGMVSALSAVTLAIGLALQDIIGGAANGLMLVSSKLFKVGDYVDIGNASGTVKEIKLLHTVLATPDNKSITIPNKTVYSSEIVNYSAFPVRRIDAVFGIDYDSDIEKAKSVLLDLAARTPKIVRNPQPIATVKSLESSEIQILLRVWVESDDYWDVTWFLNEEGLKALEKNGVGIPYNQITVSYREKG